MKFYNIYFENGERTNGQITKRKLVEVESYIDFGDGKVSKFVYDKLQKAKEDAKKDDEFDLVIKEYSKGDCVSIHVIGISKIREKLAEIDKKTDGNLDELVKLLDDLGKLLSRAKEI